MASGGTGTKSKIPQGNNPEEDDVERDGRQFNFGQFGNNRRNSGDDDDEYGDAAEETAQNQNPPDWQAAFGMMQQQMNLIMAGLGLQQGGQHQGGHQQNQADLQQQPQQQVPLQQQAPQQPGLPNLNVPPPVAAAPAAVPAVAAAPPRPRPPVTQFDHVGEGLYTGAVDQDGTNPVALAIDREVTDRLAIFNLDNNAKAQDYKFALSGYDHLDPIDTYDMLTGPREFDLWKEAWRDQVSKAARSVHPSSIKVKCLLELKKCLSPTTWHWVQNYHTLEGHRDDPDAILKALQDHAHETANVANMLLKATQGRANAESNHVEVNSTMANVVRYFQKACNDNPWDGIHKWLLLINYGDVPKLRNKLCEKWEKVDKSQFFRIIENFFESNKKSSGLFASGEAYNVSGKTWQKKNSSKQFSQPSQQQQQTSQQQRQQSQQQQQRPRQQQQFQPRQGPMNSSNGQLGKCGYCGGVRHPSRDQCPANGKTCGKCGKTDHFSKMCRSTPSTSSVNVAPNVNAKNKPKSNPAQANSVEALPQRKSKSPLRLFGVNMDLNEVEIDLANANSIDLGLRPLAKVNCKLTDKTGKKTEVQGLPDTGANINVLPDRIGRQFASYREIVFPGASTPSGQLKIVGVCQTDLIVGGKTLKNVLWCTAITEKVLLSKETCQRAKWIPANFPFTEVNATDLEGFDILPDHSAPKEELQIEFPKAKNLEQIAKKFPEVFDGHIGRVRGPPAHIELRADAVPTSAGAHRRIAEAYFQPLKDEIEEQVNAGILERVEETPEANYWLHPIVVVPKKGTSKVRLCVDFRRLNQHAIRPSNPEGTPWEKIRNLPTGKRWYAVFDANKGYHQVPLDEESRKLTTFYTPHGKFRYLSLPMGYAGSQDIFTQRFGAAVDKFIEARATEDCLIAADSEDELLTKVERFFEACRSAGITLNTKKTQSGNSVIFAGYQINEDGAKLDPALYKAIADFPVPKTLTELRSFLGLAQQQAHFTSAISELTGPMHPLLKKSNNWIWTQEMNEAFQKTKKFLSTPAALAFYDHRRETRLYTDASRLNGLGFVLKQKQPDGYWKTVQAGSRYLTGAEERYAMVELELLAIAWSCQKTAAFTEGIEFTIVTDHKPLIPILRDYSLAEIENKRLQRLRMKIDHLSYKVEWIKGADNKEADALSRAPSSRATAEDEIDEPHDELLAVVNNLVADPIPEVNAVFGEKYDQFIDENFDISEPNSDPILKQILEAGEKDPIYATVRSWIKSGFPDKKENNDAKLDPFIREQDNLRLEQGVILYVSPESVAARPRLFVPECLRKQFIDLLKLLHSHPNKMVARARRSLWWPFMNAELQREHRACKTCVENSPSNPKDNVLVHEPVAYPFQAIHVDFGNYAGSQWLFGADQFTGWPIAKRLGVNAPADHLVKALVQEFAKFGIPERIHSDGGPQFVSTTFKQFCQRCGIEEVPSSPYNPQSNGIAEQTVKEMKKLVHCLTRSGRIDEEEWSKAMLVYVNTPRRPLNKSPSELMFGRDLRDGVSVIQDLLRPEHKQAIERRVQAIKQHQAAARKADKLPELQPDQRVVIQDPISKKWSKCGIIVEKKRNRSYLVKTETGNVVWRNRKFLKPMPMPSDQPTVKSEPAQVPWPSSTDTPWSTKPSTPTSQKATPTPTSPKPRRSLRNRRKPERYGQGPTPP